VERIELRAKIREKTGKGPSRRLRREGLIPAVLYGRGRETRHLTLALPDLHRVLATEAGKNPIIALKVGDETDTAILREIQVDPVRREFLHVDLCQISLEERLTAEVPIILSGESTGVASGGVLQQGLWELEVECLPTELPEHVEVDVSGLEIGGSIHVSELGLPEGITILTRPEQTVASVIPPTVIKEEVPPVEEVVAEPEAVVEGQEIPGREEGIK